MKKIFILTLLIAILNLPASAKTVQNNEKTIEYLNIE